MSVQVSACILKGRDACTQWLAFLLCAVLSLPDSSLVLHVQQADVVLCCAHYIA